MAYHYLAGLPYADVAAILGGNADAARRAAADGIAASDAPTRAPQPARPPSPGPPAAPPPSRPPSTARKERPHEHRRPGRRLAQAFPDHPDQLSRLHARLAAAAQRDGILDVAYRIIDSPVGPLLLAATEQGLVRVAFALEGHDAVLQSLADHVSPRILSAPGRLDAAARELDEYFAAGGARSTCRWTGGCRPDSAARC